MFKKKNEFELIQSYFAPLSKGYEGALALKDDAALLDGYVISTDGFLEGVHFRSSDPPEAIGEKILRASLSDIAAMGAAPECWFLTAAFGKKLAARIKDFARGCGAAQELFAIHLAGGDMVASPSASFFSVTVVGKARKPVKRSGGLVGDRLYVSGTLGDSALGLRCDNRFLRSRYLYPQPRLALGLCLPKLAHAAIDLSDGLVADLTHLCGASGCGAHIYEDSLPLSREALEFGARHLALNAGDDYELLIAAPAKNEAKLFAAAHEAGTPLTCIGELTRGKKITITDSTGAVIKPAGGYQHFK